MIVLKILGIILLIIIALILFSVLSLLFIPLRYRVLARLDGSNKKAVAVRITWFLHLIKISINYREEVKLQVKILGFILTQKKSKINAKKVDKNTRFSKVDNENQDEESLLTKSSKINDLKKYAQDDSKTLDTSVSNLRLNKDLSKKTQHDIDKKGHKKRISLRQKLINLLQKIKTLLNSIFEKIYNLVFKIEDKREYINEQIDLYYTKDNVSLVHEAYEISKKLVFHILPKKTEISGELGFEEPDVTAYLAGLVSLLGHRSIEFDLGFKFDEKVIKLKAEAAGRVYLFYILYNLLRIYFDKRTKKLLNILKEGRRGR